MSGIVKIPLGVMPSRLGVGGRHEILEILLQFPIWSDVIEISRDALSHQTTVRVDLQVGKSAKTVQMFLWDWRVRGIPGIDRFLDPNPGSSEFRMVSSLHGRTFVFENGCWNVVLPGSVHRQVIERLVGIDPITGVTIRYGVEAQ